MNKLEVQRGFAKPTPQEALGGSEGLTHIAIAQSLGTRAQDFRERFFDLQYDKMLGELGLKFEKITGKFGTRGRPTQVLVFPTAVARILVANYPNNVGMGYALWLIARDAQAEQLERQRDAINEDAMYWRNRVHELEEIVAKSSRAVKAAVTRSLAATKRTYTTGGAQGDLIVGMSYAAVEMTRDEMAEWQWFLAEMRREAHLRDTLNVKLEGYVNHVLNHAEQVARMLNVDVDEARKAALLLCEEFMKPVRKEGTLDA